MGQRLANYEKRQLCINIAVVYEEHYKYKGTKEFRKQRAEDCKKQTEDPAVKFAVLVRAKTAKKKITTLVSIVS